MGVYSTYSLSESSNVYNNSKDNMLDLMVESAQNDMKMFDSVIELDFMHAYSEAGLVSISEADDETAEKSIGKKLKELFEKIKEKLKTFVSTFIAKVQNLMHNDVNLYKENIKDFNKANGKSVKIDGYQPIKPITKVINSLDKEIGDIDNAFNNILDDVDRAKSEDEVSKILEGMNETKYLKRLKNSFDVNNIYFEEDKKKDDYVVTANDMTAINSVMASGGKKIVDMVRQYAKEEEKAIDDVKKTTKLEKYMAGYYEDKDKDLAVCKANAKYKICNKFASYVSKETSMACNGCARYVAAARKGFMAISRKGSSLKESADLDFDAYILGEASDIYVERALSMVG